MGRGSEGYQGSFRAAALLGAEEKRQILEQTLSSSLSVASAGARLPSGRLTRSMNSGSSPVLSIQPRSAKRATCCD